MEKDKYDSYNDGFRTAVSELSDLVSSLITSRMMALTSKTPEAIMTDDDAVMVDCVLDEKSFLKDLAFKVESFY